MLDILFRMEEKRKVTLCNERGYVCYIYCLGWRRRGR